MAPPAFRSTSRSGTAWRSSPASCRSPSTSADPAAAAAYAAALALVPGLADHAGIPGTQPYLDALPQAEQHLARALRLDPSFTPAAAACGNAAVRRGDLAFGARWYRLAVHHDPTFAAAWLALGELESAAGEGDAALGRALALGRRYSPAHREPAAVDALVLLADGPWHRSIPLDAIVDPARVTLHRWYLAADDDCAPLPPHRVVINALPADAAAAPARARAVTFAAASACRTINDPRRIAGTARHRLAATLAACPGCVVPPTQRVAAADAAAVLAEAGRTGPTIVRPLDAHGGRGTALAPDSGAAVRVAAELGGIVDLTPFVDYRSADGRYRKLRIVFVDGVPYPYHLAAGEDWMLHAYRTEIAVDAALQREEQAFLDEPVATVPGWNGLSALAAAVGLDYFGIDAAVLGDGRLVVFEADPAMLVQRAQPAALAYRAPAVTRVAEALHALIERGAQSGEPCNL